MRKISKNRSIDDNGNIHITNCVISKSNIRFLTGKKLKEYTNNLDKNDIIDDKEYTVYTPISELEKISNKINNIPLTRNHKFVNSMNNDNIIGHLLNNGSTDGLELKNDIVINTVKGKQLLRKGIEGLSLGYNARFEFEEGEAYGKKYNVKMVDIIPNHVMLTKSPKIKKAKIGDSNQNKGDSMKLLNNIFNIFNKDKIENKDTLIELYTTGVIEHVNEVQNGAEFNKDDFKQSTENFANQLVKINKFAIVGDSNENKISNNELAEMIGSIKEQINLINKKIDTDNKKVSEETKDDVHIVEKNHPSIDSIKLECIKALGTKSDIINSSNDAKVILDDTFNKLNLKMCDSDDDIINKLSFLQGYNINKTINISLTDVKKPNNYNKIKI